MTIQLTSSTQNYAPGNETEIFASPAAESMDSAPMITAAPASDASEAAKQTTDCWERVAEMAGCNGERCCSKRTQGKTVCCLAATCCPVWCPLAAIGAVLFSCFKACCGCGEESCRQGTC